MALEPEVLPEYSQEGNSAKPLNNKLLLYLCFLCAIGLLVLVLKLLMESILIFLGLVFIWKLAVSKP
tara:strand:- start:23 stop:223 length:201 start_codon:yes stop_codon:yes gene_type:complete